MERDSRRGRGETRRAGNTSRGRSTSNASSLSRSDARSRRRSRSVDSDRRSGRSVDNDRNGRIISSNHPSDDSDVRPLTASSSNPATITQGNYITSNVAAATYNARTEAVAAVTQERVVLVLVLPIREELGWELVLVLPIIQRRERGEPAVPIGPADRAAVQQLPRVIISEQHINDDNNSMCSICREQYKVGEEARVMPCGHMHHQTCIFRWLERQHTCPLCRFELPIQDAN